MLDNDVGTPKLEGKGLYQYGSCKTTISVGVIYPRDEAKGKIGRAYLYMDSIKVIFLDPNEKKLYMRWHNSDPPDPIECRREKIISEIQGGHNIYISNHPNCKRMQ